jgi:hypothetical protein
MSLKTMAVDGTFHILNFQYFQMAPKIDPKLVVVIFKENFTSNKYNNVHAKFSREGGVGLSNKWHNNNHRGVRFETNYLQYSTAMENPRRTLEITQKTYSICIIWF